MADKTPVTGNGPTPPAVALGQERTYHTQMSRILAGFGLIYLILQAVATWTQSLYGEMGALICALVLAVAILVERWMFQTPLNQAFTTLGLGRPDGRGMLVAAAIGALLLVYYPAFAWATGATLQLRDGWPVQFLGLALQGGVAEELLWRGYLFGHLRRGRSFWNAALLSMLVMATAHLLLFVSLPFPVALTATLVSVVISFPLSQLYALGGNTIWGPALVHAVVQGAIKLVVFPAELMFASQIVWMLLCMAVPLLAFAIRRPIAATRG